MNIMILECYLFIFLFFYKIFYCSFIGLTGKVIIFFLIILNKYLKF